MAAARVPSVWSTVWRNGVDVYNPVLRSARAAQRIRAYHPSYFRPQQQQIPQRYGTANEPPPHLGRDKGSTSATKQLAQEQSQPPTTEETTQRDGASEVKAEVKKAEAENAEVKKAETEQEKKEPATVDGGASKGQMADPMLESGEQAESTNPQKISPLEDRPLETILNSVPDPAQQRDQEEQPHAEEHDDKTFDEHSPPIKAPHIDTPRHVHHFDTYGLVKTLAEGGWDKKQAITTMKAVRLMLANNTDLAKEALVSKSNLENEVYLFKAACAELKTEVTTRRRGQQEKMRTERTQLQHEVDIISQRLGQETATLKDDLRGMFDDRKMSVRNEQRTLESKIQQANYRIQVELQADGKSEVEELRWIMTRRVILTLFLVVLMVVGGLKIASDAISAAENETKKKPSTKSGGTQTEFADKVGESVARNMNGGEAAAHGSNQGYVSLG